MQSNIRRFKRVFQTFVQVDAKQSRPHWIWFIFISLLCCNLFNFYLIYSFCFWTEFNLKMSTDCFMKKETTNNTNSNFIQPQSDTFNGNIFRFHKHFKLGNFELIIVFIFEIEPTLNAINCNDFNTSFDCFMQSFKLASSGEINWSLNDIDTSQFKCNLIWLLVFLMKHKPIIWLIN